MNDALDSSTGYILEVDLKYPQDLHTVCDLPFYPINRPENGKTNFLRCTVNSDTSYIIVICLNSVLVTVFKFQKFIAY